MLIAHSTKDLNWLNRLTEKIADNADLKLFIITHEFDEKAVYQQ